MGHKDTHKDIHEGHRQRICKKASILGLEFLEPHEQLEKLLYAVIPRGDTNKVAHDLLRTFGSIKDVLCADVKSLTDVDGVGPRTAEFLHDLPILLGIVERCIFTKGQTYILDSTEKIAEFSKSLFYGHLVEILYAICLNNKRKLIRSYKISEGTTEQTCVSVHKIARLAILNEATYVVLTHNHPGGRCEPSVADLKMTAQVRTALDALGVQLLGHVIV
ncbi:MAG: RadC family protein, partial [Monoglobaceae bacterium]